MYGIQVLAWPLIGLMIAVVFMLFPHRAKAADLLMGGALAATLGGVFGYLLASVLSATAMVVPLGIVGAVTWSMLALFAAESKADRLAHR